MKKFNSGKIALLLLAAITLSSCSNSGKSVSTLTGWEYNDPKYGGFHTGASILEGADLSAFDIVITNSEGVDNDLKEI